MLGQVLKNIEQDDDLKAKYQQAELIAYINLLDGFLNIDIQKIDTTFDSLSANNPQVTPRFIEFLDDLKKNNFMDEINNTYPQNKEDTLTFVYATVLYDHWKPTQSRRTPSLQPILPSDKKTNKPQ